MTDTRQQILQKNFEAIHRNGFQGTRTDKVIAELGVTKGAFYHYFRNKKDLGYAVIEEIISPMYVGEWRRLDDFEANPLDGIIDVLSDFKDRFDESRVKLGCPLNNLVQEMAPLDEGFRQRLTHILREMHAALTRALQRAADQLQLTTLIEPSSVAYFILAALEGSFSVAKSHQSKEVFDESLDQLIRYIRSLKR